MSRSFFIKASYGEQLAVCSRQIAVRQLLNLENRSDSRDGLPTANWQLPTAYSSRVAVKRFNFNFVALSMK